MAGTWTDFKQSMHAKGFMLNKSRITHLLLDGGKLSVPNARYKEFLAEYAKHYLNGVWMYVSEMKSEPVFHMMCEFDLKLEDPPGRLINADEVLSLVRVLQTRVITPAFSSSYTGDLSVAVCTAPPKDIPGGPFKQCGIHCIWRVPVTRETALRLRSWMILELHSAPSDECVGKLTLANEGGWEGAFDICVLQSNGLRMIGSRKAIACPKCGHIKPKKGGEEEEKKAKCPTCGGTRKLDQGRAYTLEYVVDKTGAIDPALTASVRRDVFEAVSRSSIRVYQDAASSIPCAEFPSHVPEAPKKEEKRKKNKKSKEGPATTTNSKKRPREEGEEGEEEEEDEEIPPEDSKFQIISRILLEEYDKSKPIPTKIKRTANGKTYFVNTRCRYCLNKGAEHNHSTVYFVISARGIRQKCYCRKPEAQPRGHVPCAQYTSPCINLANQDLKALFDPSTALRAIKKQRLFVTCAQTAMNPKNFVKIFNKTKFSIFSYLLP